MAKEVERCPHTNRLLRGPLINKTDAGPGRLSREASSLTFRQKMWEAGMIIMLSIPNGTSANAEMDQLYAEFQPQCKKSAQRVASLKLAARVAARKAAATKTGNDITEPAESPNRDLENALDDGDLEDFFNEEGDEDVNLGLDVPPASADPDGSTVAITFKGSVCSVTLNCYDLAAIVNGFPHDPIEKRPFDYCFQKDKIKETWRKVGFLPMTRNAVNDERVRYEMGDGGAPPEIAQRMELLVEDYHEHRRTLQRLGFNGNIFDVEIPVVKRAEKEITVDEEKQIEMIIQKKAIAKSGKLFKMGIHIANCKVVLEAQKRIKVLEDQAKRKKEELNEYKEGKLEKKAVGAYEKWMKAEQKYDGTGKPKMAADDYKDILKVLLPRVAPEETVSQHASSGKKALARLMAIGNGKQWEEEMAKFARGSLFSMSYVPKAPEQPNDPSSRLF